MSRITIEQLEWSLVLRTPEDKKLVEAAQEAMKPKLAQWLHDVVIDQRLRQSDLIDSEIQARSKRSSHGNKSRRKAKRRGKTPH